MTQNKLVRSSLLVAVGSLIPAAGATAAPVFYSNQALFEGDATGLGMSQLYVETFEENNIGGAYALMTPPLSFGVPNTGFPTGLDAPDLTITSAYGGTLSAVLPSVSYWPNIVSTVVGTNSEFEHTVMQFGGGGVDAVGFEVWGIQSFTTNFPLEINYTIYDTGGGVITSGVFATPTSDSGAFVGVISDTTIGSIDVDGVRFGLSQQEYLDNIQAWRVPGPGTLALLGLAGLTARRRRR